MEKRIKLHTSSKNAVENLKKQGTGRNSSNLKSLVTRENETTKKTQKKVEGINGKRRLSHFEIQETHSERPEKKSMKRRSKTRLKHKLDQENSSRDSDDQSLDESLGDDIKTKKLKDDNFAENTANLQSQAYEIEVHLELTDEETQTSKGEDSSNSYRLTGSQETSTGMMDQCGIGQSIAMALFSQQNALVQALNSNSISEPAVPPFQEKTNQTFLSQKEEKSSIHDVKDAQNKKADEINQPRFGHYSHGDKPLRIIKSEYNDNINDVVFTMNWKKSQKLHVLPETSQITREELLKFDPLLLVYYYEKHLEFTQYPDYTDLDLDRIPH